MATPQTAINAGINFLKSKSVVYPRSFVAFTLINSAIIATKMQFNEQITHARLGVVVISPINCPRYQKATQLPQMNAPLAVSHDIMPLRAALIEPGNNDIAANENRATAYSDASTPGCYMTIFAQAKLDAHNAHKMTTTPRQNRPSLVITDSSAMYAPSSGVMGASAKNMEASSDVV